MRVVVTGSRGWVNEDVVHARLAAFPPETVIVHGWARGADQIADVVAHELGLRVERHPADWERYGRAGGVFRNVEMLDTKPDLVLAFWDGHSLGTGHCIGEARRRGIPVEVVEE